MRPPRIVIFGGSGFIGAGLARRFEARGHDVWPLGAADCDLEDPVQARGVLDAAGSEAVVLFASAIGRTREDSVRSMEANVRMAVHVAEAARVFPPARIVFLSSTDVFGAPERLPVTEDSPPLADTFYGVSKYASERLLAMGLDGVCPLSVLRLPGVFGPDDGGRSVVGRFLAAIRDTGRVVLTGEGRVLRDYVWLEDLARLLTRLIGEGIDGVFNVASGRSRSLAEIAALVRRAAGLPADLELSPGRDARSFDRVFDNARLLAALPDFAFTPLEESAAAYVRSVSEAGKPPQGGLACPVCGRENPRELPVFRTLPLVTSDCRPWPAGARLARCRTCGQVHKPVTEAQRQTCRDIYAGYALYSQAQGREPRVFTDSGAMGARCSVLLRALEELAPPPDAGRLLDLGCGTGAFLQAFSRRRAGWELHGADANPAHREAVLAIPGVTAFHQSLDDAPGTFDLIAMAHFLEHLAEPLALLEALRGRLAPGGTVVVLVPDASRNPFDLAVADHLLHFDPATLEALFTAAGLRTLVCSPDVVPKEISLVARAGEGSAPSPAAPPPGDWWTAGTARLREMRDVVHGPGLPERFAVFGAGIAAAWLEGMAGDRIDCFVDEDANRVGQRFLGRPVTSPEALPRRTRIVVPLVPALAAAVTARLRERGLDAEAL